MEATIRRLAVRHLSHCSRNISGNRPAVARNAETNINSLMLFFAVILLLWCVGVLVYRFVCWIDKITSMKVPAPPPQEEPIEEEVKSAYVNKGYLLTEDYRKRKIHRMMTVVEISIFNKTNQRVKLQYPENDDEVLKLQSMYDGAMGKK